MQTDFRRVLGSTWLLLIAAPAEAWEDHAVLRFIAAQQAVLREYRVPGTLQRLLDNTKIVGRLGGVMMPIIAADDVVAAGGSQTAGVTAFGGIQVSIPLSSVSEQQQQAVKQVELAKAIEQIKTQALQDMAQLRSYQADLAAAEVRMQFFRDQAGWLKQRIEEGYNEMGQLWTVGARLNEEQASVEKIRLLAAS